MVADGKCAESHLGRGLSLVWRKWRRQMFIQWMKTYFGFWNRHKLPSKTGKLDWSFACRWFFLRPYQARGKHQKSERHNGEKKQPRESLATHRNHPLKGSSVQVLRQPEPST